MSAAIVALACAWLTAALAHRFLAFRALLAVAREASAPAPERDRARAPAPTTECTREVALTRPLHGAPPSIEDCLESYFTAAEQARARMVLGLASKDDPALAVAEHVRVRRAGVRCDVRIGRGPAGSNRKVANLAQMIEDERAEIVVLSDADVRVPPDFVARIVSPFADPKVGLATCPYASVPSTGLSSRIDALITNTHFLPSTCLAVRWEGLRFALGAAIAVRRAALDESGGFACLVDEPVDDYALARNVARAGWKLAWVPMIVEHMLDDARWSSSIARHVRWASAVRASRPAGYVGMALTHGIVPALALALAIGASAAWIPIAWWVVTAACAWRVRRAIGFTAADALTLPAVDIAAFAVWIGGFFTRPTSAVSARSPPPQFRTRPS